MKKIKESRTSSIPMLEIIFSIGIFTMISVFVLQLFLSADVLQKKAKDTSKAIICAENIVEVLKASDSFEEAIELLGLKEEKGTIKQEDDNSYQLEVLQENSSGDDIYYSVHYNQQWEVVEKKNTYSVVLVPYEVDSGNGIVTYVDIFVYRLRPYHTIDEKNPMTQLYHLKAASYFS